MPTLPAPFPLIPGASDLVVSSTTDTLAATAQQLNTGLPAPVRDALVTGLTALLLRHQELSGYAAAQNDETRATDVYLRGIADDLGVSATATDTDATLRPRIQGTPNQVSPTAILAAANAVLAPLTAMQAQYFESVLDRLYITDGTAPFHSFIGASPQYPDRLYPDDAALNGGAARPLSNPGKAWTYSDTYGHFFCVRVPDLGSLDGNIVLVYNGTLLSAGDTAVPELGGATPSGAYAGTLLPGQVAPSAGGQGLFIADGSNASGAEADGSVATFLYSNTTDALSAYQAVANAVEAAHGHSIRWQLIVDSSLP